MTNELINSIAPLCTPYDCYRYLWSPRPETATRPEKLDLYSPDTFIGQAKFNGANTLVFTNGTETHVMNRHNETKSKISAAITESLHRGNGWIVLNGEYMEKSRKNSKGENFNGNYILFDILVFNGKILTGSTFQDRYLLLNTLYSITHKGQAATIVSRTDGSLAAEDFLTPTAMQNVWIATGYVCDFSSLYKQCAAIDMVEGLVLKRAKGKLNAPVSASSNKDWQLKCRKPTKIYNF